VACTDAERDYLLAFASHYFAKPVSVDDVVWTYSGVRPLYNDGAKSATAATRDYVLSLDTNGAPLLNVFGGKITTYRRLAESALAKLSAVLSRKCQRSLDRARAFAWGDFPHDGVGRFDGRLKARFRSCRITGPVVWCAPMGPRRQVCWAMRARRPIWAATLVPP
jgi:glycerol-3-phosphate dehydrogenase